VSDVLTPEREAEIRSAASGEWWPDAVPIMGVADDLLAEIDRLRAELKRVNHLAQINKSMAEAAKANREALREAGDGLAVCVAGTIAAEKFQGLRPDERVVAVLAAWRNARGEA
jgi:hypothetical protein